MKELFEAVKVILGGVWATCIVSIDCILYKAIKNETICDKLEHRIVYRTFKANEKFKNYLEKNDGYDEYMESVIGETLQKIRENYPEIAE